MLGPSGHIDTFSRDRLPPAEQWPVITSRGFDYPEWLNAGAELTDRMQYHWGQFIHHGRPGSEWPPYGPPTTDSPARATMVFTETLKSVGADGRLEATIDRDSVRRISSPEVIRKSAINFGGKSTTWSVPLKNGYQSCEVESDPQGIRINNSEELKVLEALLQVADPAQK